MKQLLFLLLFPCLALAQYTGNGNQKISLGEQTTADGLVYRGIRADTASKIVPFSDTSAYIILDTVEKTLWLYKAGQVPKWQQVGGSAGGGGTVTSITGGTGLTGGTITTSGTLAADTSFLFTQSDTLSLNLANRFAAKQNNITLTTTGTSGAATLTGATLNIPQYSGGGGISDGDKGDIDVTNSGATWTIDTSAISLSGNKVTGILPVANGGTGQSTLTANKVMVGNGTSGVLTPTNLHWDNTNSRLGINNTSPESRLHVKNNANAFIAKFTGGVNQDITFNIYADSDRAFASAGVATLHDFNFFTNDYDRFIVRRDGESWFLTGNAYPPDRGAYTVQVNNSGVWGAGAYVDGSDLNIKDNIENIDSSLYLINLLTPVIYNYKKEYNEDESKQIGFIAQDVYNVLADTKFPHAIIKSDGDILSMAYSSFIPLLTKAIQEQNALIKALEQRILILENK